MAEEIESEVSPLGCKHYGRKCAFISPCCKKIYTCRLCHNENELHEIDRREVSRIKCLKCDTEQKVQRQCEKCGVVFGNYFCAECRLFDDEDKQQFHCTPCGICRIGGRENYYHCDKCDLCLAVTMKDAHKCVENASRSNCPVCMEDLHTSRIPCHIPKCGHLIHKPCFYDCLKTGNYTCPVCNVSMVQMDWDMLDREIEGTPMPDEYKDMKVQILCRDCHQESRTLFHVVGLKCKECGSYNTCRAAEPENAPNDASQDASQDDSQGDSQGDRRDGDGADTDCPSTGTNL